MSQSPVSSIRISILGLVLYPLIAVTAASPILVSSHHAAPGGSQELTSVTFRAAANSAAPAARAFESGTLTLSPQDTVLNINDTNYSTYRILTTYTWPDYRVANAILMKFDLSAVPRGALVEKATLRLALVQSDATAETYTVAAHKLLAKNPDIAKATGVTTDGITGWTPNSCCYNNVPLAQADLSAAYDARPIDRTPGFKAWDLTTMVQEWLLDPATNFGVVLNSDASKPRDRYRFFASMEDAEPGLRPYLELVVAAADVTPPLVAITAPAANAPLSNAATVTADASDNVGVAGVQLQLNGTPLGSERTAYPYTFNWDTTSVSDGNYALTAVAWDAAGNRATSAPVNVSVQNGLLFLASQGTYLNLDAANHSTETILATYTWPDYKVANAILLKFDLSALPAGAAVQEARLFLALVESDNTSTSTYTVKAHKLVGGNTDMAKATGYTADGVSSWISNACCYNNIPLAQANISPAYDSQSMGKDVGFKAWTITAMVQEWLVDPATNFGLLLNSDASTPRDRYRLFASGKHPDPALRPFLRIRYVPLSADSDPPAVSITSPWPETYLAGVVQVAASAIDDRGVAGVQFQLDGASQGAELTAEPYVFDWDTSVVSDGEYILTAKARDAAGNVATSKGVRVKKDKTPPTVSITAPAGGANVWGTVTVSADASDTVGVAGVQFTVDGTSLGAEVAAAPYTVSWNTAGAANGAHTITAVARDAAGNAATSAVTVTVANAPTIASFTPTSGPVGNAVAISGTNFTGATAVRFSGTSASYTVISATAMSATVPAGATTGPISVTTAGGTATSSTKFTVIPPPTIDSFTPTSGPAGTAVTISGTNFTGATAVRFNGTSASYAVISATAMSATVPAGATSGPISVTTAAGTATSSTNFTVIPPPTIASFTPTSGPVGTAVTISGTNFAGATGVKFNGTTASFTVSSGTAIQATVPSGATTGPLSITTPGGTTTSGSGFTVSTSGSGGSIASRYPGDVGIESDPNVVFVERFDESSLTTLYGRWTDVLNGSAMSISGDAPSGSPVGKSLDIPWSSATNGGHLYRQLSPGIDDTLYVRYYVKYPSSGSYQHEGVWMGGTNPPLSWPNPQAGIKPTGSDRFMAAAEQRDDLTRFDHYDYWMGMRQSGDGNYWGNVLLNSPNVRARAGEWMCVEHMVKLNNPVTSLNGEHAIWLDGVKVSHLGQGFPNGYWSGGIFTQDPSGSPFQGFQWRNTTSLNLNWIWLQVYAPNGGSGSIKYSHVVAAKSYIGCFTSGSSSDSTPPTVSITAPAGGATMSGTVTVSATASDDIGVAGVQFKLNGVNLGAEDTAAPYSVSWDTTSVANGSRSLTAVARDAGGNQTTSPAVSVTVSNGSSSGGVIFESNWAAATGTSSNAVTDGGLWPIYSQYDNPPTPGMTVVTGGPNGRNALRVQQRGPYYPVEIAKTNFVAQSRDYYLRYYFKTDDTSSAGDHIATVGPGIAVPPGDSLTFLRKYGGSADWRMVLSAYGCGDPIGYPLQHWGPGPRLSNGQWYRLEYYVHFSDATHMQVHPRVYDATGALLYDDNDFRQESWGTSSTLWNGRNDWTLASFYAAGHSFCVDPSVMNDFGMGNNGQAGASNTGRYWYFAAVQIRTDTWPGPVSAAGTAASTGSTPPLDRNDMDLERRPDAINTDRLDEDTLTVAVSRAMSPMERSLPLAAPAAVLRRTNSRSRGGRRRRGARADRRRSAGRGRVPLPVVDE